MAGEEEEREVIKLGSSSRNDVEEWEIPKAATSKSFEGSSTVLAPGPTE